MTSRKSRTPAAAGAARGFDLSMWLARAVILGLVALGAVGVQELAERSWGLPPVPEPEAGDAIAPLIREIAARDRPLAPDGAPLAATPTGATLAEVEAPAEAPAESDTDPNPEAAAASDTEPEVPSKTAPSPGDSPAAQSAHARAVAFEQAPGVLGISIRTLRREQIKSYASESLGLLALGLEDIRLGTANKGDHIEANLAEHLQFEGSGHAVPKKARRLLDGIGRLLAENPDTRIEILAHTDSEGDAGYNKRLSQRRADAVKAYLVGRGVAPERIEAVGRGEEAPLIDTGKRRPTRSEREKNRRVELKIAPLPQAQPGPEDDAQGPLQAGAEPGEIPGGEEESLSPSARDGETTADLSPSADQPAAGVARRD